MNINMYGALDLNKTYAFYADGGPLVYSAIAAASIVKEEPQRPFEELVAMRNKVLQWQTQSNAFYTDIANKAIAAKKVGPALQSLLAEAQDLDQEASAAIAIFNNKLLYYKKEVINKTPPTAIAESKSMLPLAIAGIAAILLLKG